MSDELTQEAETPHERDVRRAFLFVLFSTLLFWGGSNLLFENFMAERESNLRWLSARRAEPAELISTPTTVRFIAHRGKGAFAEAKVLVEGKWRTPNCLAKHQYFDKQAVLSSSKSYFDRQVSITYNRRTLRSDILSVDLCELNTSPETAALLRCEPVNQSST